MLLKIMDIILQRNKLIERLSRVPLKEKARIDKYKRNFEQERECTFIPKLTRWKSQFKGRSRSIFNELYEEKKKRDISRRKQQISERDKDLRNSTFVPHINSNFNLRESIDNLNFNSRLQKDLRKRKEKQRNLQERRKKWELNGWTFTPKLIAKSLPRINDSDDEDDQLDFHTKLYKKYISKTKRHQNLRDEYEAEVILI